MASMTIRVNMQAGSTDTAVAQDAGLDFKGFDTRQMHTLPDCRVYVGHVAPDDRRPALVFVAGAYHGGWCYDHYLNYFARHGVSCFALDLPGQGALGSAQQGNPPLQIADLADALRGACRYLDRPLVLVGHSMGALPVMAAASCSQVHGVVLLAPSPPGNLPGAAPVPVVPQTRLVSPPDEPMVRRRFVAVPDGVAVDGLTQRLTPVSAEILNDRYRLRFSLDPAGITCPGICFEAELDDHARHPPGQDKAVADFLGFDYQLLRGQPHSMMYGPLWLASARAIHQWYAGQFAV